MATLYLKTGATNWTAASSWSNVNASGVDNSGPPLASDNCISELLSGSATIDAGAVCRSYNETSGTGSYAGTLTHTAGVTLTIGDGTPGTGNVALKFAAGSTYTLGSATTSAITFMSTSGTVQTLTFAGKTTGSLTFDGGGGGSWQFADALITAAPITHTIGTLDTNGKAITGASFSSSNANTRTLTLGASAISLSSVAAWDQTTITGLTMTANTAVVTCTASSATFTTGALNLNGLTLIINGAGSSVLTGAMTLGALTRTATAVFTCALVLANDITVTGTFTPSGNSAINRLFVRSSVLGTARTITAATVTAIHVDFRDITGAGAGSWNLAAITGKSGDAGGNSGITFTTAATQTWSGNTGGNWSANAWTTRVPLPQDNVTLGIAWSGSQTITLDTTRLGKSISFTGTSGSPAFNYSTVAIEIYGSLTLTSGVTLTGNKAVTFLGRGAFTLTNAGRTWFNGGSLTFTIAMVGGTLTLQDAFSSNIASGRVLSITNGTFNSNNFAVSFGIILSNVTTTRAITMGSSTWTASDSGTTVWDMVSTGLTFTPNTSNVVVSSTGAGSKVFNGGGLTYNTVTFSGDNITVNGNNTYATLALSNGGRTNGIKVGAGSIQTFTTITTNSSAGNLSVIQSSSAGSAGIFSKASGTVSLDFMSIKDNSATGGAIFFAGANSVDNGGNSGWNFQAQGSRGNMLMMGV